MVGCNSHAAWHRAPGKRSTKTASTPSAGILLPAETMIIAARAAHGQTARRGAILVLCAFAIISGIIALEFLLPAAAGSVMPRLRRCWVGGLSIARRGLRNEVIGSEVPRVIGRKSKAIDPRLRRECGARQCKGIPLDDAKDSPTGRRRTVAVTAILLNLIFLEKGNRVLNGNHDRKPGILSRRGNRCLESLRRENR